MCALHANSDDFSWICGKPHAPITQPEWYHLYAHMNVRVMRCCSRWFRFLESFSSLIFSLAQRPSVCFCLFVCNLKLLAFNLTQIYSFIQLAHARKKRAMKPKRFWHTNWRARFFLFCYEHPVAALMDKKTIELRWEKMCLLELFWSLGMRAAHLSFFIRTAEKKPSMWLHKESENQTFNIKKKSLIFTMWTNKETKKSW